MMASNITGDDDLNEVPVTEHTDDKTKTSYSFTRTHGVEDAPLAEPATTNDRTYVSGIVTEADGVEDDPVTKPLTTNDETKTSYGVTGTDSFEDASPAESATTNDRTNASEGVTEADDVKDAPVTEPLTTNDRTKASFGVTGTENVDDVTLADPVTTKEKTNASGSVAETDDMNDVHVNKHPTTNDETKASYSVIGTDCVEDDPLAEPVATKDITNAPGSVTEADDVKDAPVTESLTTNDRTNASYSVTGTDCVEDAALAEPAPMNDRTNASGNVTEADGVIDVTITEPLTTNNRTNVFRKVSLLALVLVAPTLIVLAWIIYYNIRQTSTFVVAINITETLMATISIVFIGFTLVRSAISTYNDGVDSSSQYNLLRHNSSETIDRKLKLITFSLITILLLGYTTFGVFQSIHTASCGHEHISIVFKLIRDIAEMVFAITQVLFLIVSMSKWSRDVMAKLDILLAVILSTNIVFILRFCMQAYADYRKHNLSQLPNLTFCTTPNNSSICDAYTNNDDIYMYTIAYLYSFEVEYLLFCMVTISLSYGVHETEEDGLETPELILESPSPDIALGLMSKLLMSIKNWFMLTLKFVSINAFYISILVCILKFVSTTYMHMHAFYIHIDECNTTKGEYIIYENTNAASEFSKIITGLGTAFSYMLSIVAFLAVVLTTEIETLRRIKLDPKDWILLFVTLLHFLLTVLETVEIVGERIERKPEDVYVTHTLEAFIAFHFLGLFCQPLFILHYMKQQRSAGTTFFRYIVSRGCIVFFGVFNFEQWIEDILFAPYVMVFLTQAKWETYFELSKWWLFVKLLYPFVCFYRLLSSLLCCRGFIIRNIS